LFALGDQVVVGQGSSDFPAVAAISWQYGIVGGRFYEVGDWIHMLVD
jgi:hypothetical protein